MTGRRGAGLGVGIAIGVAFGAALSASQRARRTVKAYKNGMVGLRYEVRGA